MQAFRILDAANSAALPNAYVPSSDDLCFNVFQINLITLNGVDPCALYAGGQKIMKKEAGGVAQDLDAAAADGADLNGAVRCDGDRFRVQKSGNGGCAGQNDCLCGSFCRGRF